MECEFEGEKGFLPFFYTVKLSKFKAKRWDLKD
jgi:hypothetical protein